MVKSNNRGIVSVAVIEVEADRIVAAVLWTTELKKAVRYGAIEDALIAYNCVV